MKMIKLFFILLLHLFPVLAVAQTQNVAKDPYTDKLKDGIAAYQSAINMWKAGNKDVAYKERDKAKKCFTAAKNRAKKEQKQEIERWIRECDQFPSKIAQIRQTSADVSSVNKWSISWDEENQCIKLKSGNQIECYKMIRVEGGTYGEGETILNFSIGETEVTELLWNVVMKDGVSSRNLKPKTKFTWVECNQFMDKLSEKTGVIFRLPEANEWEYAASGGNKTNGYAYAGSDGDNLTLITYIDGKLHSVKGKGKNELGLYDMTGNAYELTSTPHEYGGYILKGGSYIQANKNVYINYKKLKITRSEHFIETDKKDEVGFRMVKSYE